MSACSELANFERELAEALPNKKHRNQICFAEAYHLIEEHLARKIPLKTIMTKFNVAFGLSVHPARFRQLLEDERARRSGAGLNEAAVEGGA